MVIEYRDTVSGSYEWIHAIKVLSASFLTFGEVESSLSSNAGMACGAKSLFEEMQSCSLPFKSCAVIPYGSFGGGRNVIGK
jgi:hypothetical protein